MGKKFFQYMKLYKKKSYIIAIFFFSTIFAYSSDSKKSLEKISGYQFAEPSTQEIEDDDFINPAFLWIDRGHSLWKTKKFSERVKNSCFDCHGDVKKMKGISLEYPKVLENKLINLDQRINLCLQKKMGQPKYEAESKNLLSLSALISLQSRGLTIAKEIDEKNKEWFEKGRKLYFTKIGQMGVSCNQCHDDRVGQNLRAEKVSQGHINGFPSYLLRWSKLASVHKRIQFCNEQARAKPFKLFSDEYNALQLYLLWRGNGMLSESPSVRK